MWKSGASAPRKALPKEEHESGAPFLARFVREKWGFDFHADVILDCHPEEGAFCPTKDPTSADIPPARQGVSTDADALR